MLETSALGSALELRRTTLVESTRRSLNSMVNN